MGHKKLIRNARAIVSCDALDTVYYDSDMLIDGYQIKQIGKNLPSEGCEVLDGSSYFLYPGLVNTHHHFFQTFVRNLVTIDYPNLLVVDWLDLIYPIFAQVDSEVIYYSSLTAMADLLKHGCTTAFDHQYCYTKKTGKSAVDRQMEAASLLGIRYHAGRGCNTLEKSKGSTIPDEMLETTDEFLSDCERLIKTYHNPNPNSMSQIVVAPCQPINSYQETFTESLALARKLGVRLHTHLGEGENPIMLDRVGKRTLAWAQDIGFIGSDVWYAHGWELQKDEYSLLGSTKTGLSHCPAPAVLGGFPIIDIPAMQKAGMIVSLGCDGSATNDSSNLLDSLRMAYLAQSYHSKERGGAPSSYDMLKVATINGAKTLGREDIGSLEVGKAADLFAIDVSRLELAGTLHDPRNLLSRCGVSGEVALTMVGGNVVFQDGQLLNIDEKSLAVQAEKACTERLRTQFPTIFG
ncbi:amidohydrolase family protein [Sphaerochaeta globosa]|uniref:Hydroxydechloroatrazine ethylaminohydrolase n=1 Tax=Sphaerochaeta globosa (strain ATCC BAA-1886 / DSM 22777 / Buddy) TaxID=158189 RepID=F0RUC3_SPHGB|nr:amidohydrolase family protein [Sphaerochaeta globosa]ADY12285.1 Hydroxydechloroatrazine ethylaminohydrolase [Sphaerochaeta globosa str. Buddy]